MVDIERNAIIEDAKAAGFDFGEGSYPTAYVDAFNEKLTKFVQLQASRNQSNNVPVVIGWDMEKYPYSILFNSIAASVNIQGAGIGISVKAFEEEMVKQVGKCTSPPDTASVLEMAAHLIDGMKLTTNQLVKDFESYNEAVEDAATLVRSLIPQPESTAPQQAIQDEPLAVSIGNVSFSKEHNKWTATVVSDVGIKAGTKLYAQPESEGK